MAGYSTRIENTQRLVIALDLPTNGVEARKALAGMRDELASRGIDEYDDTVTVEADDEELRFIAVIPKEG